MRKGFFLTESEKNRISSLYESPMSFLLEAVDPPQGVDQIKDFQKWMDDKFGAWAESKRNPGTYYKVSTSTGYGNFGDQTKKAWEDDSKGGEYRKEKGIGGSDVSVTEEKKWFFYMDGKPNGPFTEQELKDKISKNEITAEVYVWHPTITKNPVKAKNVTQLEVPPSVPSSPSTGTQNVKTDETGRVKYQQFEPTKIEIIRQPGGE